MFNFGAAAQPSSNEANVSFKNDKVWQHFCSLSVPVRLIY